MLSFCWSSCGEEEIDRNDSDTGQRVIAREVRPGLVIVQNSKDAEETLRIIREYDNMQGQVSPCSFSQYGGVETANTRSTYLQAPSPPYYSNVSENAATETLIDIDMDELCRPPPYAPMATYK